LRRYRADDKTRICEKRWMDWAGRQDVVGARTGRQGLTDGAMAVGGVGALDTRQGCS
jgi:hypothetical protein